MPNVLTKYPDKIYELKGDFRLITKLDKQYIDRTRVSCFTVKNKNSKLYEILPVCHSNDVSVIVVLKTTIQS